ncbi:MAG: hypothetical protein LBS12_02890 [Prevotellaceae bacterium]|jgi:hypothetical protein|nr:hypothetical protein [Prevotellaceae bacterium]
MKKRLFILSVLSISLSIAFGQARVAQVRQLGADYAATPPTVTFEVYWNEAPTPPRHRDTVWVFIDIQPISFSGLLGNWTAATITDAVVDAGTGSIVAGSLNGRGFYLDGHAGPIPFSSTLTVTLDASLNNTKFNWCAFVSDYPPNATLGSAHYELHGTTPFVVNGTTLGDGVRSFSGECITALTDATGCPGLLPTPPVAPVLMASPDSICFGDTTTLTAASPDAVAYRFEGNDIVGGGGVWQAGATARVSPAATAAYTIYIKNAAGCTATGALATITVLPLPEPEFINPPDSACAGSNIILTATAGSGSSYCFWQECTACVRNPYFSGNDAYVQADCNILPTACTYSADSTYALTLPESGSVTVWVKVMSQYGCVDSTSTVITVIPLAAARLISAAPTGSQVRIYNEPIDPIIYTIDYAPCATVTGLPAGMTYSCTNGTLTITGAATALGTYTYTITPTGSACPVAFQDTLVVAPEVFTMIQPAADSIVLKAIVRGGYLSIDWGDGSPAETFTPTLAYVSYTHHYSDNQPHTITGTAASLTRLNCDSLQLTALDVTQCRRLTDLRCFNNQLSALDVRNNTALTYLSCSNNSLTALDVSQNTLLTNLNCGSNKLTALDVTKDTALVDLVCSNNKLAALDISHNRKLRTLYAHVNLLKTLDVTPLSDLTILYCHINNLTELNVDNNTKLQFLFCADNPINTLDVTMCPDLVRLDCYNNLLSVLDVTENPLLKQLACGSNALASLDVSENPELTYLHCSANNLAALNVSSNPQLAYLFCAGNALTTLDVSSNNQLRQLYCYNNSLPALTLSNHPQIDSLICHNNFLTALNVSSCTALCKLMCQSNLLDAAALDALFGTLRTGDGTQTVYILNNPRRNPGINTGTSGCTQSIATARGWIVNTDY